MATGYRFFSYGDACLIEQPGPPSRTRPSYMQLIIGQQVDAATVILKR